MRQPHPAAGSPLTWLLALVLVAVLGAVATRPAWLWRKDAPWIRGGLKRVYIWQTYDVARTLYGPRPPADVRVALLGNSRVWMSGREPIVKRELERIDPDRSYRVDNLSIFGARVGDMEILSRHMRRIHPSVVVVTIGASDLVSTSWGKIVNPTGELLDIGWSDGPVPADGAGERVDRWLRTLWPFYRFRRFERALLGYYLLPGPRDDAFPDGFASSREYFDFIQGKEGGAKLEAEFQAWKRTPTLEAFADFLRRRWPRGFGLTEPVPEPSALTRDSLGATVLDRLLERLAQSGSKTFVLVMPENPLLEQDREARYHRPGFSDRGVELIREVAERHGIRVVDGRRWMPAETFADLNHVMPDVSGFQRPLAKEILDAIGS